MIHGTTDRLLTWCMDEVIAVDGWSIEVDSVECIECLRRQGEALREENARLRQRVEELEQIAAAMPSVAICRQNRAEGRGPCGACALCCKEQFERAEAAEAKLERMAELADHAIPFYAYGDNEAAVDMSHRLEQILAAAKGGE